MGLEIPPTKSDSHNQLEKGRSTERFDCCSISTYTEKAATCFCRAIRLSFDFLAPLGIPVYTESSLTIEFPNSCSYEAGTLEQTELEPPADMWTKTVGKFIKL